MKRMSLKAKLGLSWEGFIKTVGRPKYCGLALLFAVLFAALIYLIINWGVYGNFLFSSLSVFDKIGVVGMMLQRMFVDIFTTGNGALLMAVSLLQGVSLSLLVFTMKNNRHFSAEAIGSGGIAALAAALGLGCVPCGTSIILPIVSLFFSSSAYAAANVASTIVLAIAFLVSLYSIYSLGYVAYPYTQTQLHKKELHNNE